MATAVPSTHQDMTVAPEPPSTAGPAAPSPLLTPDQVVAAAGAFAEWLARPRVRVTVIGALLLLIGGLIMTNSVWTLPLVLVGALMVVIAWIGRRLDGRFAVDWGETGTQLEFRAEIRAARLCPAPVRPGRTPSPAIGHEAEAARSDIVDGEAHTVEIDVADLRALIAAAQDAETAEAGEAHAGAPAETGSTDATLQATRGLPVADQEAALSGGAIMRRRAVSRDAAIAWARARRRRRNHRRRHRLLLGPPRLWSGPSLGLGMRP